MQIPGPNTSLAPLTTGHPVGLPGQPAKTPPHKRVAEPGQAKSVTGFDTGQKPVDFWRASTGQPNPNTHVAPPSLMQLKITQLLDDQVKAQQDNSDTPEPTDQRNTEAVREEAQPVPENTPQDDAEKRLQAARQGYSAMERNAVLSTLP